MEEKLLFKVINGRENVIGMYDNKGKAVNAAFQYLQSGGGCSGIDLSMANDGNITRIYVGNTDSGVRIISVE